MKHYQNCGQPDQALHIYRQCQRILKQGSQIALSAEIQSLAQQIAQ